MSNTNKQLLSPEEIRKVAQLIFPRRLPSNEGCNESGFIRGANWMREQIKGVVKYTLEQAAEKAQTFYNAEDDKGVDAISEDSIQVDKQSILSLEEQIIKDLGYE